MACECVDTSNPSGGGCCSISPVPPSSGVAAHWSYSGTGVASAVEIPVYQAGITSPSVMSIGAATQFWLYFAQVLSQNAGEFHLYRGTSVGASSNAYATIARGYLTASGGYVANLPLIPLAPGDKVWCLFPTTGFVAATLWGRAVTVAS